MKHAGDHYNDFLIIMKSVHNPKYDNCSVWNNFDLGWRSDVWSYKVFEAASEEFS